MANNEIRVLTYRRFQPIMVRDGKDEWLYALFENRFNGWGLIYTGQRGLFESFYGSEDFAILILESEEYEQFECVEIIEAIYLTDKTKTAMYLTKKQKTFFSREVNTIWTWDSRFSRSAFPNSMGLLASYTDQYFEVMLNQLDTHEVE